MKAKIFEEFEPPSKNFLTMSLKFVFGKEMLFTCFLHVADVFHFNKEIAFTLQQKDLREL